MLLVRRLCSRHGSDVGVRWRLMAAETPSCGFQIGPKMRFRLNVVFVTVAPLWRRCSISDARAPSAYWSAPQSSISFSKSALHTRAQQSHAFFPCIHIRPTFWAFYGTHVACKVFLQSGSDRVFELMIACHKFNLSCLDLSLGDRVAPNLSCWLLFLMRSARGLNCVEKSLSHSNPATYISSYILTISIIMINAANIWNMNINLYVIYVH